MSALVYVMHSYDLVEGGRSASKIGVSKNPTQRRASVQSWERCLANNKSIRVRLVTTYVSDNPFFVEAEAGRFLLPADVIGNEWFAVEPIVACHAIESALKKASALSLIADKLSEMLALANVSYEDLADWRHQRKHRLNPARTDVLAWIEAST